jgi:L-iditol 2-dehydrogenase
MKALVLTEYKKLEYVDYPMPEISVDAVLIRVKACGICGSDVHGYDGSTGRRVPPVIMGHEASGEIVEIGKEVEGWKIGDRVTFDSTIFCGKCEYCRLGLINLCNNRKVLGVSIKEYRQNGAFAEFVAVPQRILYRLPEGVSYQQAALVEPLSIAFHAINLTPVQLNDTAVVVGAGMIGLLIIQTLKTSGVGRIIALDVKPHRLELAKKSGADDCLKADDPAVIEEIFKLTHSRGADIAFDVVGTQPSILTAIASLRKGGSLTLIGNITPQVSFPLQTVVTRQISIRGSCASNGEYGACLDFIARNLVKVDLIMEKAVPLSEGAQWFDRLYAGKEDLMKVLLVP